MVKNKLKRSITYIILICLITPFLTGVLLVQPAMAADSSSYQNILKGLLMMFFLSFIVDEDDSTNDSSNSNITVPDIGNINDNLNQNNNYTRYQPRPGELETLAKAIYSEARGESYIGQVAVAAVILNRIESSKFPNSIDGVVYEKVNGAYAFSAVLDGQIDLNPNQTAYKVAKDALNGWDPTDGALYYYNPETATASWIFNNTETIKRIGNHVFARRKV
ncbi:cell wall hydrolase [Selenihalanaerobacter shriftii]|uniref:N-acetylmuramoyl-L-alanine amidase n=1 Tax=Selenihalanaerobacter shriftii TaxID=142842 RepID=A0A1T4LTW3_9FIRM|nr:cell wall hydrolase [Selenihalanaerobacter shriftii]SJZ58142.1 N-acetylmuramoyl-L-alanine amidase [Selenihalanaerobacter shriftii]